MVIVTLEDAKEEIDDREKKMQLMGSRRRNKQNHDE